MKKVRNLLFFFPLIFLFACASLVTQKSHLVGTEEMLKRGDYGSVLKQIELAKDVGYKEKDRVLYYLDTGMLNHYYGVQLARRSQTDPTLVNAAKEHLNKAIQNLSKAESNIEDLYSKSISKEALSFLANDNVKEYSGEDFEDVYINVFKALTFLELRNLPQEDNMDNFDKAFVEIRKINVKLTGLEQKYSKQISKLNKSKKSKSKIKANKSPFVDSVLGRYLSMLLYRADGEIDDARIDLRKIGEIEKLRLAVYNFQFPNFGNVLKPTEKAKVNLMSFVGRGADKKAKTLWIHTEKDMIIIATGEEYDENKKQQLNQIDAIPWKDVEVGYHFKFQLPYIEKQNSEVYKIKIIVDDKKTYQFNKIESLENAAVQMYKLKEPIIYLKTIARSVAKGIASQKAKKKMEEKLGKNSGLGMLARLATDIAVDATETADLRISHFFPANAYIKEFEVPAGKHSLKVQYVGKNNTILYEENFGTLDLKAGEFNFLESFYLN